MDADADPKSGSTSLDGGEGGPKAHLAGQDEFSQLGVVHPGESGGKRVAL